MGVTDRLMHHAVRRGVEYAQTHRNQPSDADGPKISTGSLAVIYSTAFALLLFYSLVQYTLRHVVSTLCIIESPATAVTITVADADDDEARVDVSDKQAEAQAFLGGALPKMTIVNTKPITSKIRSTIKHITSQAGWTARFRGMLFGLLYVMAVGAATSLLNAVMPRIMLPFSIILNSILVAIVTAPMHMIWTHATIAMPGKKFMARYAAIKGSYKQLWLPAMVYEAVQLLVFFQAGCSGQLVQHDLARVSNTDLANSARWLAGLRIAGVVGALVTVAFFVVLPAKVQLVRVEASMLPDEDDTIIPFDRTFDGKVVPKVLGGSGAIGFMDAWRSFNREARLRLIKLFVKIFLVSTAIFFLAVHIMALELWALAGEATKNFVVMAHAQLQQAAQNH
ncbi:hypothetical protein IWX90DRAFT_313305 [Phyllosticta citrichinensis]|uniref:Ubiquitin carrier protein n=1 Tax=Phyllosticta citrichinensis TaxID=1130410 RepID=A0ABR1XM43_9PEZI